VIAAPAARRAAAALAALLFAVSCSSPKMTLEPSFVVDPKARIVSLVPSMTEDLFAIGAGSHVVGVSSFTDYPPAAKRLPVVASFASVDTERIVSLHATLCVGIEAQQRLAGDVERAGIPIALLKDDSFEDIFTNLEILGKLTGRTAQAQALEARLRARTATLVQRAKRRGRKPSVFVVLGVAPVFTIGRGSYIEHLIELAGGRSASSDVAQPYARYSAEALVARQPDVIISDPDIRLSDVIGKPPWTSLRAVKQHHVYTLPDAAILERPGPRYNDGLAWLIATLDRAAQR
jgi:ABC-type Fe3+-hydroxamate transport system substrate-binding protein